VFTPSRKEVQMATKRGRKGSMTDNHKAALAQGRSEGRVVRSYLIGLRAAAPRRGRPRTTETIERRLAAIEDQLTSADPIRELRLVQEKRDLHAELASMHQAHDVTALEDEFVGVAKDYSERNGISYQAWREVGVPAAVLSRAGISRSR
jgi:hypothetical protein